MTTAHRTHAFMAIVLALSLPSATGQAQTALPVAACPQELPERTRCYSATSEQGLTYWIAVPSSWNNILVLYAHDPLPTSAHPVIHTPPPPPTSSTSSAPEPAQNLKEWALWVREGYAWASTTYNAKATSAGSAAADMEGLRQIFVSAWGTPKRTVLHGQGYGAHVAAKTLELYAHPSEKSPYDGALLSNSIFGGPLNMYQSWLNLRVIYQYICKNHPRANEVQYPLWMGLAAGQGMSANDLISRVDECLGLNQPAGKRTPTQQTNLREIQNILKLPVRTLVRQLGRATWQLQAFNAHGLYGPNALSNLHTIYRGSSDDARLNAQVLRYDAEGGSNTGLMKQNMLTGQFNVPVLTLHAMHDPVAFVDIQADLRDIVAQAQQASYLAQIFTDESAHNQLSAPEYPAAMHALLRWIDKGEKPNPGSIQQACQTYRLRHEGECRILPPLDLKDLISGSAPSP